MSRAAYAAFLSTRKRRDSEWTRSRRSLVRCCGSSVTIEIDPVALHEPSHLRARGTQCARDAGHVSAVCSSRRKEPRLAALRLRIAARDRYGIEENVGGLERAAAGEDDRALHDRAQLAYVPGPLVADQRRD